jgi:hypothetical protein
MAPSTLENYVYDLGHILKAEAVQAAAKRDDARPEKRSFYEGLSLGYINVLQLVLSQAKAFDLEPKMFRLDNFNPDDLL